MPVRVSRTMSGPGPGPGAAARSSSVRRLSTTAAEMALVGGIDLAQVEEVVAAGDDDNSDSGAEVEEEGEEEARAREGRGNDDYDFDFDLGQSLRQLSTEEAELALHGIDPSDAPPPQDGEAPRSGPSSRHGSRAAASRRTSQESYHTASGHVSAGSIFSTGSHGSLGSIGSIDGRALGLPGLLNDEEPGAERSVEGVESEGGGSSGRMGGLTRRASTKSIDLGPDIAAEIEAEIDADDREGEDGGGILAPPPRWAGAAADSANDIGFTSPAAATARARRESPPRYDPEAIGKVLGDDSNSRDSDDAEEAAWSEVRKYERSIPGYEAGHNRRASDYAHGNDADADFEKEWGDMVAVSAAGCSRSLVLNRGTVRMACGVLAFSAAAVAVGVGTYTGVERMYSDGAPAPAAEVSERERLRGALPTPLPPEPPSDLADVCSVEAVSSSSSAERQCRDECAKAECCFADPREYPALSCRDDHEDACRTYESYCTALDLAMLGEVRPFVDTGGGADADEEAAGAEVVRDEEAEAVLEAQEEAEEEGATAT